MKSVAGKVAFVTGGASGLGLAMARSFVAAGMKVAIADIEQAALATAAEGFRADGTEVLTVQVDVTDRDAMERAAQTTESAFGKVHLLCNNAGVSMSSDIDLMTYADWDWVIGINLLGVINGVQTFVERLKAHGEGGHIVNTASIAGLAAIPRMAAYSAAKYAVVGLSETMRVDLMPHAIGVSVLCPGMVRTNILDSARNRPDAKHAHDLKEQQRLLSETYPGQAYLARMQEVLAGAIDASAVGNMVLHAIQNDEFYILTHPELRTAVDARTDELGAAFERWARYRREQRF